MNQKPPAPGRTPNRPAPAKSSAGPLLVFLAIACAVAGFFIFRSKNSPPPPETTAAANAPTALQPAEVSAPSQPAVVESPPEAPAPAAETAAPVADNLPLQTPEERLTAAVSLLTSPTYSPAEAQQVRTLIDSTYGPLYQQLGLNQADSAALGDLLAQRFTADRTGLAAAAGQGLNLTDNPLEVALQVRAAVAPVDAQISTLLGGDAYQQYQAYAAPIRAAVAGALRQNQR